MRPGNRLHSRRLLGLFLRAGNLAAFGFNNNSFCPAVAEILLDRAVFNTGTLERQCFLVRDAGRLVFIVLIGHSVSASFTASAVFSSQSGMCSQR